MKTHIKLIILAALFSFAQGMYAQIVINEIMYDPEGSDTGREWVEIYNGSDTSVDISGYKFFENEVNHRLTLVQGTGMLSGRGYAVIADDTAKFLVDYAHFRGLLFDSSFSLSNTGETLMVKNNDETVDSVSYSADEGGTGGTSLSRYDASFSSGTPSPGRVNEHADQNDQNSGTENNTTASTTQNTSDANPQASMQLSSHSGVAPIYQPQPKSEIIVSAGRKRMAAAGSPVLFEAKITDFKNVYGADSYRWSFGDGGVADGRTVYHTYEYPGEYVVILNGSMSNAQAVSKTEVKVIKPEVVIIDQNASATTLYNRSKYEINLGGWAMWVSGKKFVFPQDTLVKPGVSISIPATVSRIDAQYPSVHLKDPRGYTVSEWTTNRDQYATIDTRTSLSELSIQDKVDREFNEIRRKVAEIEKDAVRKERVEIVPQKAIVKSPKKEVVREVTETAAVSMAEDNLWSKFKSFLINSR